MLGLSPAENALALRGPAEARLGEHPEFAVSLTPRGRRLVRLSVFAPDGSPLPAYAQNALLEDGAGTLVLPSALNDPAGAYTLRVADVLTGAGAEAKVRLR